MTHFCYPANLTQGADGRWLVVFPDVPGCVTDGSDRADAMAEAADALEEALARCIVEHDPIPEPSPAAGRPLVSPGAVIAGKAALYTALREAGLPNTELARRLGCAEGEVRRMLDPRHATKIGRLEQALAAVGRRLTVMVDAA